MNAVYEGIPVCLGIVSQWVLERYTFLLYSWHFSRDSAPIHWLVHCHMTPTVKMKLFPGKCHEQATLWKLWRQTGNSSLLPGKCCRWNLSAFLKICFCFVLLYSNSLNDWSLGEQWILFPLNVNTLYLWYGGGGGGGGLGLVLSFFLPVSFFQKLLWKFRKRKNSLFNLLTLDDVCNVTREQNNSLHLVPR